MKRKQGIAVFLAAALCFGSAVTGLFPATETAEQTAYAANENNTEYVTVENLGWGIDRSKGAITWVPREWTGGTLPDTIDGTTIKSVADYACRYHDLRGTLVIPEGYTSIGEGAFTGNYRLEGLQIPKTMKKIGHRAFASCDELETVTYSGKAKNITFGNYVFRGDLCMHPDYTDSYKSGIYYKQLHEVKLTGDIAKDVIRIGKSQLNYHQGNDATEMHGYNKLGGEYYTEYNYYTGSPDWQWGMKGLVKKSDYEYGYGGWCGNFTDWCWSMSGAPMDAWPSYYMDEKPVKWSGTTYGGGSYKLKPGDGIHMGAGHYCFIVSVKTSGNTVKIKTLNGNPEVCYITYTVNKKTGANTKNRNFDVDEIYPLKTAALKNVSSYKVTFDADGGESSVTKKTVYEGACFGVLPKPTRAGYIFDNWYTEKNGGGKKVTAYRNVRLDGNITLYANWKKGKEPAYLDPNTYVSKAPEHSSIMDNFAQISIAKSTVSYSALQQKAQKVKIKVKNSKGAVTYKNVTSGDKKKYLSVSKKGVIKLKKGAPTGTYSVHVHVEEDGQTNMTEKTVSVTVK